MKNLNLMHLLPFNQVFIQALFLMPMLTFLGACSSHETSQMTSVELGILIHDKGCKAADETVSHQPDPDFFIGIMHETGMCRTKDYEKALDYYRRSSRRDNDKAMYSFYVLSNRADRGWDLKQQDARRDESMIFLQRAAQLGNPRAAYVLSICFEHGACGLRKDIVKANELKAFIESKKNQ